MKNCQGSANKEYGPDFYFVGLDGSATNSNVNTDYQFQASTSHCLRAYFQCLKKLSITPGLRYEYISTNAPQEAIAIPISIWR